MNIAFGIPKKLYTYYKRALPRFLQLDRRSYDLVDYTTEAFSYGTRNFFNFIFGTMYRDVTSGCQVYH